MSFYNLLFGQDAGSDAILATIGRTKDDFHRFRDCFVTKDKIAVYTRNGGGNRDCWHVFSPRYGLPECKHHTVIEPVRETRWVSEGAGLQRMEATGRIVDETFYVCEEPETENCQCTGCFMTFHVHKLPFYSHDSDDDFDSTYATIYFNFPPEYADGLRAIASNEPFDPDERWTNLLDSLKASAEAK